MGEIGSHPCPSLDQNWTLYPVFLLAPPPALGPALAGACSRELLPAQGFRGMQRPSSSIS